MGCDFVVKISQCKFGISIHAAQMGCDWQETMSQVDYSNFNPRSPNGLRRYRLATLYGKTIFQSTQPKWAATLKDGMLIFYKNISIHAAQMGCDYETCDIIKPYRKFQSTQPKWAAQSLPHSSGAAVYFKWAATFPLNYFVTVNLFQSTQPKWVLLKILLMVFQSTQPKWAATLF